MTPPTHSLGQSPKDNCEFIIQNSDSTIFTVPSFVVSRYARDMSIYANMGAQRPETLRHSALDHSLNSSYPNEEREEISSVNADSEEPDVEEVERIRSVLEETNKCYFCEYKAPVPWIHPSKGDNLSGMDIWDHVWSEHPQESEWFA